MEADLGRGDGALLVLSREGGAAGERALPLLVDDGDWDAFTDRIGAMLRELEDADVTRLLLAGQEALGADLDAPRRAEARSFVAYVLGAVRRAWDGQRRALPVFLLAAWYEANRALPDPLDPPRVERTWVELHPRLLAAPVAYAEWQRADDWLSLAQTLATHDPGILARLGFPEREEATLRGLSEAVAATTAGPGRALALQVAARLRDLVGPQLSGGVADRMPSPPPVDERWWVPEDIEAPPSTELATRPAPAFTRAEVDRVLRDL